MGDTMSQLFYGGLIAALLTGGGTTAYYFTEGAGAPTVVTIDGDLCRTDQPLAAHRAIIVDTSDRLSDEDRKLFRRTIDEEATNAADYEKVSVLAVDAQNPYVPKRLFSACAPKKSSDAKGIAENPQMYGAVWKRQFGGPLNAAIDAEMSKGPQDHTPLIESIWAVSRLYDFGPGVPNRRLVIDGSDMLQNTASFSQYRNHSDFKTYARTEFGRLHLPNLRGVEVVIVYLARPTTLPLQTKKHIQFWVDFFKAAGASNIEVVGGTDD